jgi:hypothetical protein
VSSFLGSRDHSIRHTYMPQPLQLPPRKVCHVSMVCSPS